MSDTPYCRVICTDAETKTRYDSLLDYKRRFDADLMTAAAETVRADLVQAHDVLRQLQDRLASGEGKALPPIVSTERFWRE